MLSIEEFKIKFPNSHCFGSFNDSGYYPGIKLIIEGLLEFSQESAFNWYGPFAGNHAQFSLWNYTDACFATSKYSKDSGKKVLEVWAKEKQDKKDKATRSIFKDKNIYEEPRPSIEYPIRLWMMGNDDTSYSKFYQTEQKAIEELNLFIANEPLDFNEIIRDFNFIFTN